MKTGTVSNYIVEFGVGFITPDEPGRKVLFTDRVVVGGTILNPGTRVEYEIFKRTEHKPEAKRVRPI